MAFILGFVAVYERVRTIGIGCVKLAVRRTTTRPRRFRATAAEEQKTALTFPYPRPSCPWSMISTTSS